jgi:hypothetical protein
VAKLKLSEWASIAEIIASFVVIASLAYIGLEINQNTQALQQETHQSVLSILTDTQMSLAIDTDFNRIVMLAESTPNKIQKEEWTRFARYAISLYGIWEYLYLSNREYALSDNQWSAFEPYFLGLPCKPGFRRFWNEQKTDFAPLFGDYVEGSILGRCVKT